MILQTLPLRLQLISTSSEYLTFHTTLSIRAFTRPRCDRQMLVPAKFCINLPSSIFGNILSHPFIFLLAIFFNLSFQLPKFNYFFFSIISWELKSDTSIGEVFSRSDFNFVLPPKRIPQVSMGLDEFLVCTEDGTSIASKDIHIYSSKAHRVNSPTPPGTGVTSLPSVLKQSPTILPSSVKLIPTSTTGQ